MNVRMRIGGLLMAGGALVITGCSQSGTSGAGRSAAAESPAAASPGPSSPGPTRTPRRRLKPGAKGDDVRALQKRLRDLHYPPGKADGRYGTATQVAVWAFEKVNGLKVRSTIGEKFWAALDAPKAPRPVAKKRERDRVDIDLRRQYMVLYKDGSPALISHISSGSGEYFCSRDFGATASRCRYAGTGTGDFRTGRRASGWERSPLGQLYNPIYFNGGIALHGALDVLAHPASHGCVRLPMHVAEKLPKMLGTGVPVHVRRPK